MNSSISSVMRWRPEKLRGQVRRFFIIGGPRDVALHQPGRALFRCAVSAIGATSFALGSLGGVCAIGTHIGRLSIILNYAAAICSSLATLVFCIFLMLLIVGYPALFTSRVPPPVDGAGE